MTDRELLEDAARAAGIELPHFLPYGVDDWMREWNPLDDDGDALRLAVSLKIDIEFFEQPKSKTYASNYAAPDDMNPCMEFHADDSYAATRRAIVRAAAAMAA